MSLACYTLKCPLLGRIGDCFQYKNRTRMGGSRAISSKFNYEYACHWKFERTKGIRLRTLPRTAKLLVCSFIMSLMQYPCECSSIFGAKFSKILGEQMPRLVMNSHLCLGFAHVCIGRKLIPSSQMRIKLVPNQYITQRSDKNEIATSAHGSVILPRDALCATPWLRLTFGLVNSITQVIMRDFMNMSRIYDINSQ